MTIYTMTCDPVFKHAWRPCKRSRHDADMDLSLGRSIQAAFEPYASRQRAILVDIEERNDHFEVMADLPGVKKEDIMVNIERSVLALDVAHRGAGKDKRHVTFEDQVHPEVSTQNEAVEKGAGKDGSSEEVPKTRRWYQKERGAVFARRRIRLPKSADTTAASAIYKDGVLSIKFPKRVLAQTSTKIIVS